VNPRVAMAPPAVAALVVAVAGTMEATADAGTFGHTLVPGGVWIYGVYGLALAVLTGVLLATDRRRLAVGCAVFATCALASSLLRGLTGTKPGCGLWPMAMTKSPVLPVSACPRPTICST